METAGHDLTAIALVIVVAVGLGVGLLRLRLPAIVGYILAGVILGPTGFGLVAETESIALLAELGVLMLLFLVGMELSIKAFVRVLWPSVIVVSGQVTAALIVALSFGYFLGWPLGQSLLLGFIVALSSTAVAIKMLEDVGELRTPIGQITVGIMIAQDLAIVPMLIITNALGSEAGVGLWAILKVFVAMGILAGLIAFLSRRGKLELPGTSALVGRVDMISLAAVAACFSAAAVTGFLGLSPAYGAFLAGLVIANSTLRSEAIRVTEPMQSVLIVVFFLSIGLLIDLQFIWQHIFLVVSFTLGVVGIKSALNVFLLRLVGEPLKRALPAGLVTAQIGEFSFVLLAAGAASQVIDQDGYKLAIAVIAMTLLVSPFWMITVRRFHDLATEEMTNFRAAMAEIYAEEFHDIEEGRARVSHLVKHSRRRLRALARARRIKAQKADHAATANEAETPTSPDEKAAE